MEELPLDTLSEIEEEIEAADAAARLDSTFDDFLFAFTHSQHLQKQRVMTPLLLTSNGLTEDVTGIDLQSEFAFLEGDYYTVLYGDAHQIGENSERQDSVVKVERISLNDNAVRVFEFHKLEGRWKLASLHDDDMASTGLSEFLAFYARFSADSVFQQESIAQPLRLSMLDPDDDSYLEGTIDAAQWSSFCPEVPGGVISNIRYGQGYGAYQLVMQKCGAANGLQELFTFQKDGAVWKLTSYEN